jgi:hypothetical protein
VIMTNFPRELTPPGGQVTGHSISARHGPVHPWYAREGELDSPKRRAKVGWHSSVPSVQGIGITAAGLSCV